VEGKSNADDLQKGSERMKEFMAEMRQTLSSKVEEETFKKSMKYMENKINQFGEISN
jgi:hypothetical protein